MRKEFGIKSNG